MKRAEINRLTEAQLKAWADSNRSPGVLPCIPVILINSLCGEKPGVSMNLTTNIPLPDILKILQAATKQVELKVKELEGN